MNKIRNISLGISIFIHTSLIGVMNSTGWIGKWLPSIPIRQRSEVALEFVEVPEEQEESKAKKETKVISDKTVEAKDSIVEEAKERKARAKEVVKGKQIAKASLHSPLPMSQIPDKFEGLSGGQQSVPQMPVHEWPKVEYDIINIPEVSESIFSTPSEGPLTFETQAHKIGPWFKQIKKKIENYWLRYLIFRYQNTAPQESEVVVSFKILPNGEVTGVKILEYEGDELFRDFCVASVTNTAPFPPLPENLEEELKKEGGLNIVFTFRYR